MAIDPNLITALQGQQPPPTPGLFGVQPQHLQQMAGDVLPMPGISPNRVPITHSWDQIHYGRYSAPLEPGSNVVQFPLGVGAGRLSNIYTQNPGTR